MYFLWHKVGGDTMTKTELESALIVAGWINKKQDNFYYNKSNNEIKILQNYIIIVNISFYCNIKINYKKMRLIEVPMKDGTQYRAIVCDTLDGLFIRVEL